MDEVETKSGFGLILSPLIEKYKMLPPWITDASNSSFTDLSLKLKFNSKVGMQMEHTEQTDSLI